MSLTSRTNVSAWLSVIDITTYWHPTLAILFVEIEDVGHGGSSVTLNLSPEQVEQLRTALDRIPTQPERVMA